MRSWLNSYVRWAQDLKEFSQQITGHYLTRVPTTPHFAMIIDDRE
jgi:hypothetical protein